MIKFRRYALGSLFYWWGGIHRHLWKPALAYLILTALMYSLQSHASAEMEVEASGIHMLGSVTMFLLVFRLNQAMIRYNEGRLVVARVFQCLDSMISQWCSFVTGSGQTALSDFHAPQPVDAEAARSADELALIVKVHFIRLIMACAVAMIMNCKLAEAAAENAGEIEDDALNYIIFLHGRLQALLYTEEMNIVDRSFCINCEELADTHSYRVEINKLKLRDAASGDRLFGKWQHSPTMGEYCLAAPIPNLIMNMILNLLREVTDKPWGINARIVSKLMNLSQSVLEGVSHIDTLITQPMPLPYLQHGRMLMTLYAVLYPWTIDPSLGWLENVVFPVFTFWAMLGLETLAGMMENPIGITEADLDLLEMLHRLEVSAAYSFDMSQDDRLQLQRALVRMAESSDVFNSKRPTLRQPSSDTQDSRISRPVRFESFFKWMPMPTILMEQVLENHGRVDIAHRAWCESGFTFSMRRELRKALRRHKGNVYHELGRGSDAELSDEQERHAHGSALGTIQRDPTVYCHYLCFIGVRHPDYAEHVQHEAWKQHVCSLLKGHPAASLVTVQAEDDSERSVLDLPVFSGAGVKFQAPEAVRIDTPTLTPHDSTPRVLLKCDENTSPLSPPL